MEKVKLLLKILAAAHFPYYKNLLSWLRDIFKFQGFVYDLKKI